MRNALDEILFGFFGTPVGLGNMGDTEGPPRTIGEPENDNSTKAVQSQWYKNGDCEVYKNQSLYFVFHPFIYWRKNNVFLF